MNPQQPATDRHGSTAAESLWQFVRLRDYRVPDVPARSAAAKSWSAFKDLFHRVDEEALAPIKKEAELRALPEIRLQHLVPPIDWSVAAAALDTSLEDPLHSTATIATVQFVIGPPHCGHAQIVRQWGVRHDAELIEAPTVEQILAGDQRWFDAWPGPDRRWVLPDLERCYLRHASGLALVRELFARVANSDAGRGLIGCDSWAWAYLQRVWPLARPDALTLQGFDGDRLSRLFAQFAAAQRSGRLRFRNARTGDDMLSLAADAQEASPEIIQLAAHCRGNVGTARSYWRQRLRAEPEEDGQDLKTNPAQLPASEAAEEIVWVSAARQESAAQLEADEDSAIVLHALLLHNGLPAALLPELLPLPHHRCLAVLMKLREPGLVQLQDGRWSVDPLGYALARELLRGRDYLTDDF